MHGHLLRPSRFAHGALALSALLTVFGPAPAAAQTIDLTELTLAQLLELDMDSPEGAARYLQKISEAPASITVITAAQIRAFGYRTVAEVLASVPGVYVTDDRNYSYFGARGLTHPGDYNARVLLLIDGHRINDNIYDSILAGTEFPLDVDLIDRLEVIRGPGSVLYGSNAFAMTISIVTRRGARVNGTEVSVDGGTLGTGRGRVTFGRKYGDLDVVVSATGYVSRGEQHIYFPEFDAADTNGGIANDADRDRSRQVFANVSFGNLTLRALYGARRRQVPTASFNTVFNDGREQTFDRRSFAELQWGRPLGLTGDVLARVYYDGYHYAGRYPTRLENGGAALWVESADGDAIGSELTFSRRLRRHRLMVGSEYRVNLRQHMATYVHEPYEKLADARRHAEVLGVSAADEVQLGRNVIASAGLRLDWQTGFAQRITPRASLLFWPLKRTHVKLLFAGALRVPSISERVENTGYAVQRNPLLRPESIRSLEAVVEHTVGPFFGVNASLFRTSIADHIDAEVLESGVMQLGNGRAKTDGAEMAARLHVGGVLASGSYAFLRDASEPLEAQHMVPAHLAKLNVMMPLSRHLRGGLQLLWAGRVESRTGESIDAALVTNLTVTTVDTWHRTSLGVSVFNLFDAAARYPVSAEHAQGSVPQYGRRLLARAWWKF